MRLILCCLCLLLAGAFSLKAQQAKGISLHCQWLDTAGISLNSGGARFNDVWGFEWKGVKYAAIGSTEGVHIIETNTCRQIAFYPGAERGFHVIRRDFKTYRNYLYAVCNEGNSTLQVFDLSYLPDSLHLVYESDRSELSQVHACFIDTARGTFYAATTQTTSGFIVQDHMRVYSLADPRKPVRTHIYNNLDNVHTVFVRNDTAYCSASNNGGYEVVVFRPDGSYQKIGGLRSYPDRGFTHSSWVNDKNIAMLADENFGYRMKVLDVSQPSNIRVLSTCSPYPGGNPLSIPHNPLLRGDTAFVAHYLDGLQVFDLSDPYNPKHIAWYDTYPAPSFPGFGGAWGCYPFLPSGRILVSDMQSGLYVLSLDRQQQPEPANAFRIWPVPVSGVLQLSVPEAGKPVALHIYDAAGRLLWQEERKGNSNRTIELPLPQGWAPGAYLIRARSGTHTFSGKFTKQ